MSTVINEARACVLPGHKVHLVAECVCASMNVYVHQSIERVCFVRGVGARWQAGQAEAVLSQGSQRLCSGSVHLANGPQVEREIRWDGHHAHKVLPVCRKGTRVRSQTELQGVDHEGYACVERSKTAGIRQRAGRCHNGNATAKGCRAREFASCATSVLGICTHQPAHASLFTFVNGAGVRGEW
eukprot:353082-Chlamydomonas_euryale.AAC.19